MNKRRETIFEKHDFEFQISNAENEQGRAQKCMVYEDL